MLSSRGNSFASSLKALRKAEYVLARQVAAPPKRSPFCLCSAAHCVQGRFTGSRPSFLQRVQDRHGPAQIIAPEGFNRWLIPPTAISFHLCLGGVYGWSVFNGPLTKVLGVVSCAATDWSLGIVVPVFSTAIFCLGMSSAVVGRHIETVGPRLFGLGSAFLWSGGFALGSLGVSMHSLPLIYLGYGVLGGIGLGLGYLAPVGLLMKWFPEKPGMATGMAIMGFGGGALVSTPITEVLLQKFRIEPTHIGPLDAPGQTLVDGVRYLAVDGKCLEVVAASASDVSTWPGLQEGLFLVGSGSMGLSETFASFGAGYFVVMTLSSLAWRLPAPGWTPSGVAVPALSEGKLEAPRTPADIPGLTTAQATRTPQFALLWLVLCLNTTAGIGMIGVAKDMVTEIFTVLPVVTPEFASGYVMAVSLANMGGRFFWATISDYIGRKNAYATYFSLGVPLYLSLPVWASMVSADPTLLPLALFYGSTMITFSTYGAGFATMPAYVADTFGRREVSGIFGRVLTAWSVAGVAGPMAITVLRGRATDRAIADLAAVVPDTHFQAAFGASKDSLEALTLAKTVTVGKLFELAPAGTTDPSPGMYNEVMVVMAGVQAVALVANSLIRRHHGSLIIPTPPTLPKLP